MSTSLKCAVAVVCLGISCGFTTPARASDCNDDGIPDENQPYHVTIDVPEDEEWSFGVEVKVSGNVMAVLSTEEFFGTNVDAETVRLYRHDGLAWNLEVTIHLSEYWPESDSGPWVCRIDLDQNVLAVAACGFPSSEPDKVLIFRNVGQMWGLEATLDNPDPVTRKTFGVYASLSGGTLAVLSNPIDGTALSRPVCHIYQYVGGIWQHVCDVYPSSSDDVKKSVTGLELCDEYLALRHAEAMTVFRFDGAAWNELPDVQEFSDECYVEDVAFVDGQMVLVVRDRSFDYSVYVYSYNAGAWDQLFYWDADAESISVKAIEAGGDHIVAYVKQGSGSTIKLVMLGVAGERFGILENLASIDLLSQCACFLGASERHVAVGLYSATSSSVHDQVHVLDLDLRDTNDNGIVDACELPTDCNDNGIEDVGEVLTGQALDCNNNLIPDECDFASGFSQDRDGDGIPDECVWTRRFVNADAQPGGDGITWETAYQNLQDALDDVEYCPITEIWVAKGTYRPDQGESRTLGRREDTFHVQQEVAIIGGLAGDEDPDTFDLSLRDFDLNETILSGDLAQDDVEAFTNNSENSYHVVTAEWRAVIDGFTIMGGNADGDLNFGDENGGGIYANGGIVRIQNCLIQKNQAAWEGGGVFGYTTDGLRVSSTRFVDNRARMGAGAGDYGFSRYTDCEFLNNLSTGAGGGLESWANDPFNTHTSVFVDRCVFSGNAALSGGGIYSSRSSMVITNSLFIGNRASDSAGGGAIRFDYESSARIYGCTFVENYAQWDHGSALAFYSSNQSHPSSVTVVNCILWNRDTEIYNVDDSHINISYSLVRNGWAGEGNIDLDPKFVDADGSDDDPLTYDDNDYRLSEESPAVNKGLNDGWYLGDFDLDNLTRIQMFRVDMGCYESSYWGSADCDGDGIPDAQEIAEFGETDLDGNGIPDNCDPDCNNNGIVDAYDVLTGTSEDDNRNDIPDECEDCNGNGHTDDWDIEYGDGEDCNANGILDECDIRDGESQDQNANGVPDECEFEHRVFVDDDAPDGGNGLTWATAYNSLEAAFEAAEITPVSEVWVAAGTYRPKGDGGRENAFHLPDGLTIVGGFVGNENDSTYSLRNRDCVANASILTGDLLGDDQPDGVGRDENSFHVVVIDGCGAGTVLDGFTITAGAAMGEPSDWLDYGGGITCVNSSPAIRRCRFVANSADAEGGAMFVRGQSNPEIQDCLFINNEANKGGAISNREQSCGIMERCLFVGNTVRDTGGAIANASGSFPMLYECTFENNEAASGGAIADLDGSWHRYHRCVFTGNKARSGGAYYGNAGVGGRFYACEFRGNVASYNGGAIRGNTGGQMMACGSLLVGNIAQSPRHGGGAFSLYSCSLSLYSCTVCDNYAVGKAGGIHQTNGTFVDIHDSIVWGNQSQADSTTANACSDDLFLFRTDFGDAFPEDSIDSFNEDPLFVSRGYWNDNGTSDSADDYWVDGDYRLAPLSPCVDHSMLGSFSDIWTPDDLDGNVREWDGDGDGEARLDVGAYEYLSHMRGDTNCDGNVDVFDIDPFVEALLTPEGYRSSHPTCNLNTADCNYDWVVDAFDVDAFVHILVRGHADYPPHWVEEF